MIIGIYDWANRFIDENSSDNGGSETWLIEISKAFSKMGIETHVFCNCIFHKNENITFIPKNKFEQVVKCCYYDKFIYSRGFYKIDLINSAEIDLFLHDECCFDGSKHEFERIKYIFLLSQHSIDKFNEQYGSSYSSKYKLSFNGINQSLYNSSIEKKNMMVWSSCVERGYNFFIKSVYPLIKQSVPDFEVKVCQYNQKHIPTPNGIKYIGKLNKKQLAELQCQCKLWCYPNIGYHDFGPTSGMPFNETFCITAVENACAGANIVCGYNGGLTTTLPEEILIGKEYFKNKKLVNNVEYAKLLADTCIKVLRNEMEIKCDVSKYTWENAARSLLC